MSFRVNEGFGVSSISLRFSAAVLVGGKGSRMGGREKGLLSIEGKPIIVRIVDILSKLVNEILIVDSYEKIDSYYRGILSDYRGLRFIRDIIGGKGPLSGIHAALSAAKGEAVFVCASDMPFIDTGLIVRIFSAFEEKCRLVVPRWYKKASEKTLVMLEPLFSLYSKSLFPYLESYILHECCSVHGFVKSINPCYISVSDEELDSFININTVEEYLLYKDKRILYKQ